MFPRLWDTRRQKIARFLSRHFVPNDTLQRDTKFYVLNYDVLENTNSRKNSPFRSNMANKAGNIRVLKYSPKCLGTPAVKAKVALKVPSYENTQRQVLEFIRFDWYFKVSYVGHTTRASPMIYNIDTFVSGFVKLLATCSLISNRVIILMVVARLFG